MKPKITLFTTRKRIFHVIIHVYIWFESILEIDIIDINCAYASKYALISLFVGNLEIFYLGSFITVSIIKIFFLFDEWVCFYFCYFS